MRRPTIVPALVLLASLVPAAGCTPRATSASATSPASVFRVRAGLLNLLKCPSLECDVIEDLQGGQEVAVISPPIGEWVMVRVLATGHEGYVPSKFLSH